jgi:tetratricopeptide (TPR) repeat protein
VRAWEAVGARPEPSREEALGALRAPMLGRDRELAALLQAIKSAADARTGERIVIIAPPGVGKSRLLTELGSTAAPTLTLRTARVRPQTAVPYETVAQLLTGLEMDDVAAALASAGVAKARAAVIEAEVRSLADLSVPISGGGGDLAAERAARFDAWTTALEALADRMELWLIEDVHWAGGDLLAFLDYAGGAPTRHGRLIVATARPSLLESAPMWCETTRIELGPLPATDAEALVQALLGAALPPDLMAALIERADGTPLFIEELLRTWASIGTLVHEGGAWRLAVQPDSVTLPLTVQAIYATQLDDLPPDARAVARRGSVAGRRIPLAALGSLGIDGRDGLDRLARRAFVHGPLNDTLTGDAYAYRHALLRDAGYASLARAERARLHIAMARWLEGVAGERASLVAEAVAEHYASALASLPAFAVPDMPDRGALAERAAAWYERAAGSALALSAPEAAARMLARAIELTDAEATTNRARRRLQLGRILASSADLGAAIGEMEAALELSADDSEATAAAAYELARGYMQQTRFGEAEQVTASAIERLADSSTDAPRARLQALHAWALSAQGRAEGVVEELDAALDVAQASGDPALEVDVLIHSAPALEEVGRGSDENWARLNERARATGRWEQAVIAGRMRALRALDAAPRTGLIGLDEAIDLAAAHGLTEQLGWGHSTRCEALWVMGDWDPAIEAGLRAAELAERYSYQRLGFRTWILLLPIAAARGDGSLAERYERWWAGAQDHSPPSPSPYSRMLRAAIAIWLAEATAKPPPVPSAELVDAVVAFSNPHFLAAVETVVGSWIAAGLTELASAVAAASGQNAAPPDATPLMRVSAALQRGMLGEQDQAAIAAKSAADFGAPWWELRARLVLGEPTADLKAGLGIR